MADSLAARGNCTSGDPVVRLDAALTVSGAVSGDTQPALAREATAFLQRRRMLRVQVHQADLAPMNGLCGLCGRAADDR
jgi:ABC-type transporter Mla MlaB component